jgi:hypothetical protein
MWIYDPVFFGTLGAEPPTGKKHWNAYVQIYSVGRASGLGAEATFEIRGGGHWMWTIAVLSLEGFTRVINGVLEEGSPAIDVPTPLSPLEVPQFLVAIAAALDLRWDLATTRPGGNRVLSKQLSRWIKATLADTGR